MQSEMSVSQQMETIIQASEGEISLLDVVKQAVPELAESSISEYFSFLVNGVKIDDASFMVNRDDVVKVIPKFAGGQ